MGELTFMEDQTADGGSVQDVLDEIGRIGGSLSFTVTTGRDGWWAVCKEFPGIVAGGDNSTPTTAEIYECAKEAVLAAFHVPSATRPRAPASTTQ